nr:UvrD-helicase domain-containing protein [Calditrichia bacterium]
MTSSSVPTNKPVNVAISVDLLKAYAGIPRSQQGKIREFIEKFQENPTSPGINYEKIQQWKDPNLRSVRIDQQYRGVVLKPDSGNLFMLLWVATHDEAYQWGMDKRIKIHPTTGSLQVVSTELVEPEPQRQDKARVPGLFDAYKDRQLARLGVPEELLPLVRHIRNEQQLDVRSHELPQEVYEALLMLAAGYSYEEAVLEIEAPEQPVDTGDLSEALQHPDSQRRFHVLTDAQELAEILNAPLALWRVFLHPSQQKLVSQHFNGPARVLGGAGTGKTVVAMHRTKFLAGRCGKGERVLVTTFTRNLAEDIRTNLHKICSLEEMKRIEVIHFDGWVASFLRKNGYDFQLVYGREESEAYWNNALNVAPPALDYDRSFYQAEWEQVIQAQGIVTREAYLKTLRSGRGVRLSRIERSRIWPVFEEYREQLNAHGKKEFVDATRDARRLLEQQGDVLSYRAIVVDEAQDFSSEAFRLVRTMIPESRADLSNDIFIVGDAHQRIYGHKVVLGHCGINIRGRGRRLKINYRTTEETRRWAINLLEGKDIDDLDGQPDHQRLYKSLIHGVEPGLHGFDSFAAETAFIREHISQLIGEGALPEGICLTARTHSLLKQYEGALLSAGLETYTIRHEQAEEIRHPGIRLATMHRVKGIEFDHMIIAGVNSGIVPLEITRGSSEDPAIAADHDLKERALLYVAATRARKTVVITWFGA